MLDFFRTKVSNSIVVKVLLALIILAFVLVGVGDMLRKPKQDYVFKVGGYKCSEKEFMQALNQQVAYISQNIGKQLTQEQLMNSGIYESVLNRLIDRRIVLLESEKMNLVVSDAMVQKAIMSHPAFKNKDGVFDKAAFQEFMDRENLSESKFIDMMRDEAAFEILLNLLAANAVIAPQEVRQLMIAAQSSKQMTMYKIKKKDYVVSSEPKEDELKTTLEKHKSDFMIPETRDVSYLSFSPKDVIKEKSTISDKELESGYEERKFMFEQPETRSVSHVVAKTKELAQKAREALLSGKSFDVVVKEFGEKQTVYNMPKITRESLTKDIADVVFSMKEKEYSEPLQSPIGYHIFMVEKITPAQVLPFDKVKDNLRQQMLNEKDFEKFSAFLRALDAEINNGASLEQICEKYSFKKESISGLSKDSKEDGSLLRSQNFAQIAFSSALKHTSSVSVFGEAKYFILRVDGIQEAKPREFKDIKANLISLWREDMIADKMLKAADKLKASLMLGETPNIAFESMVMTINSSEKGSLPMDIRSNIANLKKGEFSSIVPDADKNYVFILMGDTSYPDKSSFSNIQKLIQQDKSQGMVILEQYISSLRSKYKVEINKEYFDEGQVQ